MKRAILGASAVAAIALAPLCISPAQAHADDPCIGITDPAAYQACIDGNSLRDNQRQRYQLGDCSGASPRDGAMGQVCPGNFWVQKSNRRDHPVVALATSRR